jgi:hypothetical protein
MSLNSGPPRVDSEPGEKFTPPERADQLKIFTLNRADSELQSDLGLA